MSDNHTVFICDVCSMPFISRSDDDSGICWECLLKQIEELPDE